ncbi:methyltransferase domain-containing protein [Nonomuraea sp. NBC_01738]|uniref:methyltransferase domain-containing protein n=1 Tax=Nonomuraea sp. NBC_01738 TaxID=2976003 RepID=UPI002E0FB46B|nr:methyltransferase domain-containing protein [Nonomuraea sp. NBC_01738]
MSIDPIAYLDTVAASEPGRACKERAMELLDLRPVHTMLDLGCGPGTDLPAMVDRAGRVVGVDRDPVMLAEARRRAPEAEVLESDLHRLPLEDGSVDRARTDRVLIHVDDPLLVLAEFRRVARPGGRIVMAEPDWEGLLIDTDDPEIGAGYRRFIVDRVVRNARIGRRLARLSAAAGLEVRSVEAVAPVFRDFDDAEAILGLRRNTARAVAAGYLPEGTDLAVTPFQASCLVFLVVAEKA